MIIDRVVKLVISFLFFLSRRILRAILGNTKPDKGYRWIVLMYHSVAKECVPNFHRHMRYLQRVASPVNPNSFTNATRGTTYITVTFDDGFVSVIQNALPVLEELKIPATLFLPTGCLGKKPHWVTEEYEHFKSDSVITVEQLQKTADHDLIAIGSHGKTHLALSGLDEHAQESEIIGSKDALEKLLGRKITMFSAPFGSYDETSLRLAQAAGYQRFFLNIPTDFSENLEQFIVGRVDITPEDWSLEYRLKMVGAYQWLHVAITLKRKLKKFLTTF